MRGKIIIVGIAVAILSAYLVLLPSSAQDDTEARLSELETRVAALETAVAAGSVAPSATAAVDATGDHAFAFSGTGSGVIDPFDIPRGTYRITWSCDSDPNRYPSLTFQPLSGDGFFYISIGPDDKNPTEQILPVRSETRVAGEVDCAGTWSVTGDLLQ